MVLTDAEYNELATGDSVRFEFRERGVLRKGWRIIKMKTDEGVCVRFAGRSMFRVPRQYIVDWEPRSGAARRETDADLYRDRPSRRLRRLCEA